MPPAPTPAGSDPKEETEAEKLGAKLVSILMKRSVLRWDRGAALKEIEEWIKDARTLETDLASRNRLEKLAGESLRQAYLHEQMVYDVWKTCLLTLFVAAAVVCALIWGGTTLERLTLKVGSGARILEDNLAGIAIGQDRKERAAQLETCGQAISAMGKKIKGLPDNAVQEFSKPGGQEIEKKDVRSKCSRFFPPASE